jgi:aminotransferase
VLAAPDLTDSIRKVHDFLTVGAAAPLQQAGSMALTLPDSYYENLAHEYTGKRDAMLALLRNARFHCYQPSGAYYVMTDITSFGFENDIEFVKYMIEQVGVAAVPGSSFFANPTDGSQMVRFSFCKKYETLEEANRRLLRLKIS